MLCHEASVESVSARLSRNVNGGISWSARQRAVCSVTNEKHGNSYLKYEQHLFTFEGRRGNCWEK